jgi:lysozyme
MRHISDQGLLLIKRFESFAPHCYLCPAGVNTIGYGHAVRAGEDFSGGITRSDAGLLLAEDVAIAGRAVCRFIAVPLNDSQFAALCSFAFNLGGAALQRSTLRQKLNRRDYDAIPGELLRWVYAGGRTLPGLVRRRQAEGEMFGCR